MFAILSLIYNTLTPYPTMLPYKYHHEKDPYEVPSSSGAFSICPTQFQLTALSSEVYYGDVQLTQ